MWTVDWGKPQRLFLLAFIVSLPHAPKKKDAEDHG
jgi:hypothetical protein